MTANEIIFYHDKNIIITEVYTIVFDSSRTSTIRMQLSLVERLVWDQEVLGSNPSIRTINERVAKQQGKWLQPTDRRCESYLALQNFRTYLLTFLKIYAIIIV